MAFITFKKTDLQSAQIDFIIVHYNDKGDCLALTISCPSEKDIKEVYNKSVLGKMDSSSEIENHDESDGKPFHDKLHKDMMQALSLSHAETLTDFHQHWVQKGAHEDGQRRLGGGCLSKILQSFKAQGYLTKPQINSVFTVVTQ